MPFRRIEGQKKRSKKENCKCSNVTSHGSGLKHPISKNLSPTVYSWKSMKIGATYRKFFFQLLLHTYGRTDCAHVSHFALYSSNPPLRAQEATNYTYMYNLFLRLMISGFTNLFSWIFNAVSSKKNAQTSMPFLLATSTCKDSSLSTACWMLIGQLISPNLTEL